MAITTFDDMVSPADLERAQAKFGQDNFRNVIDAAKQGDSDAINLIFHLSKNVIAKAFFKYFLGDKKYWKQRIDAGDDKIFAAEAYEMIADSFKKGKGPLSTFNPDKFANDDKIVDRLRYYIFRYAEGLSFKILRERLRGGMGGNIPQELSGQQLVSSYDAYLDNSGEVATSDSFVDDVEIQDAFAKFLAYLEVEYPKLYPIMLYRVKGLSYKEIASKIGRTEQSVFGNVKKAYDLYKSFVGI